jgi:hypothetical protein
MNTEYYIERSRTLNLSQDYEYLRAAGQEYIEKLSHTLWTDFNTHDPGITIMEVLCYAITELGYRADFPIEDLLADTDGQIKNETFFTAKTILTNAPLTTLDYRKLLIDIAGVNNAWIIHHQAEVDMNGYQLPLENEVPIYVNPKEDKLSLSTPDRFGNPLNKLPIRGLNKVVVELSDDLELGQLNEVAMDYSWMKEERFVAVTITPDFNTWEHPKTNLFQGMNTPGKIEISEVLQLENVVQITVVRASNNAQSLTFFIEPYDPAELELVKAHFENEMPIAGNIDRFKQKKEKITAIYAQIEDRLQENRNLTEDWLCIDTVTNVAIGVCADIALTNDADAEEMLANIQQTIDELFNPPIRFYTLPQLLEKGKTTPEIFNGPSLKHGFLKDEEVAAAGLPDCIHASDIIAALMALEGVKAVNNVLLTAYNEQGKPIENLTSKPWCLQLNGQQRPVFELKKSKLLFFRDGIPFLIPERGMLEFSEGVYYLKTQNNDFKLQDVTNDLPVPTGTYYQLDSYDSIQEDFPLTYGIGEGHLSDKAPATRKAQAKQLKGYLQHFDQLLGDFFNQLHHSKHLFDTKSLFEDLELDKTYFTKYIENIPGVEATFFSEEVYASGFKNLVEQGEHSTDRSLYESKETFYYRKNRIMDHLMARFGESFGDYVFMNYKIQQEAKGLAEFSIQNQEIVEDKKRFLRRYPELSYGRGLGINYLQEVVAESEYPWGLKKRVGYEQRIAGLLGINQIPLEAIVDTNPKNTWSYPIAIDDLDELSFNLMNVPSLSQTEKWELAQLLINNITSYRIFTFTHTYIYFVQKDGKKIARFNKKFESYEAASSFIPKLYQAINTRLENFYCLEHILLRPLFDDTLVDADLLTVCLQDDCDSEAGNDPYSFKATVILPGWLARFRNRYFRDYAERIFRQEAPAHTLIKVCWVGIDDMVAFQDVYQKWIIAYRKLRTKYCSQVITDTDKKNYNKALSALVAQVKELNTIYDEGTLYDCKESELDNPIILNNSSLGTLQNIPS